MLRKVVMILLMIGLLLFYKLSVLQPLFMQVIKLLQNRKGLVKLLPILHLVMMVKCKQLINELYKMCTNLLSVPNPLYFRRGYCSEHGKIVSLSSDFSPKGKFIEVPCGKCAECRDSYFNSLLQRAICECRSSYMYFVTLTYDDAHIPFVDLDDERILYADYSHIQNMVKRFRASGKLQRDFRYLCVNEYGDNYSRPHFHLLFFVARKPCDDSFTPYAIESILFDNLKVFYAQNVGTRKNPIYEPLFTYCERVTPKGLRCNYWVKYVAPDIDFEHLLSDDESNSVRAIRYLLGYVTTSSRIDSSISSWLSRHSYDSLLCDKVKRLLSNHVRFSKGFGCGFDESGQKYYLPKISVRASSNVLIYSELVENLPRTADDFELLYPEMFESLLDWLSDDVYSNYSSLEECMRNFTVDDYFLHCLMLRYFPNHFSIHYRNIYKDKFVPTITSLFDLLRCHRYSVKPVKTQYPEDSSLFRFLRSGVEQGLHSKVPFIAFPIKSQQGFCALCKYYRDRVVTFDDIRAMYDSIGVTCYDEWKSLFIKSYSTRKADKSVGNLLKYKENSEIILQKQKKSLHLMRRVVDNLYFTLFAL